MLGVRGEGGGMVGNVLGLTIARIDVQAIQGQNCRRTRLCDSDYFGPCGINQYTSKCVNPVMF